ncbi:hypothetical protein ACQKNS_24390 [Peribacillus sp. NPDC094092]
MVKALQASNNRTEAESAMAKENLYLARLQRDILELAITDLIEKYSK